MRVHNRARSSERACVIKHVARKFKRDADERCRVLVRDPGVGAAVGCLRKLEPTTCHIHVKCLHVHMAPGNIRAIIRVPYTRVRAILWIPFTLFLVSPHGASWVAKPRARRLPNCAHIAIRPGLGFLH